MKHRVRIAVEAAMDMDPLSFRFFDGRTNFEISSRPDRMRNKNRRLPEGTENS
jgi:hypothetical protein